MNRNRTHPRSKPLKAMPGAGEFAHWLEQYAALRGLTQAQIAAYGGFSDSAVANWMVGKGPSPAALRRLADALGESYEMLMELRGFTTAAAPTDGSPAIPPEKRSVVAELVQLPLSVLTHFALAGRSLVEAMQDGAAVTEAIDGATATPPASPRRARQEGT